MRKLAIIFFILIVAATAFFFLRRPSSISILPTATPTSSQFSQLYAPLTITTTPSQTEVRLNSQYIGTTPLSLSNLADDTYRITFRKSGYEELVILLSPKESKGVISLHLNAISGSTQTTVARVETPTTVATITPDNTDIIDVTSTLADLERNDPNIPPPLAGKVNVPPGYRFPDNADLTKAVPLEIIRSPLVPDPKTDRMYPLEKNILLANLQGGYMYDPVVQEIVPMGTEGTQISIIDFGNLEPRNMNVASNGSVLWFNQSRESCQLRTDPKSPQLINQLIPVQGTSTVTFSTSGIYIFFCQGNPGPTQTIVVS